MFFEQLKKLCGERGTKLTTVSRELGVSNGTLGQWKNGSSPSANKVIMFAEYFGVTTDYLLLGKEPSTEPQIRSTTYKKEMLTMNKHNLIDLKAFSYPCIKRMIERNDIGAANDCLKDGWVLLGVGFESDGTTSYKSIILGNTEDEVDADGSDSPFE